MRKKQPVKKAARHPRPWRGEVRAILALALAGFWLVALATFDPALHPSGQVSAVGPAGAWLSWASFKTFGYASYLFPLVLSVYGLTAFFRLQLFAGYPAIVGLTLLFASTTGLLAWASPLVAGSRLGPGGVVGRSLMRLLNHSVGEVGTVLLLLTLLFVGLLFLTQLSYAAVSRALGARMSRLFARRAPRASPQPVQAELPLAPARIAERSAAPEPAPPLLERARATTGAPEQRLFRQETLDFGRGGQPAFQLPPMSLLKTSPPGEPKRAREELQANVEVLTKKLQDFGVEGRIVQVNPGPVITAYEFEPAAGVKVNQVVNLADDLALAMKAGAVRVVGPIPGRGTVAVEVPNPEPAMVYLREVLTSGEFVESRGKLPLALGKDTIGQPYVVDLTAMPHLLIAGATGSGKSVSINAMICSILYNRTPAEVRILMIDPKRLELGVYEGIPHLLAPVVTDPREASARLRWIVGKMDERYTLLASRRARNIESYNLEAGPSEQLPYWVVVVDELADLMMASAGEVQHALVRLAQVARAVGIHLVIATQRPSVDVVTGLIKANFSARIAFQVASKVDSRTILDSNGAEQLLSRGDMLFVPPGTSRQVRVHGAWISEEEVKATCDFLRTQGTAAYEEVKLPAAERTAGGPEVAERDETYWAAVQLVVAQRQASISFLQRRLRLGYPKAARFIDMMEQDRIIGPGDGAKPREVLVSPEHLAKLAPDRAG
ncbi:MAG: DNA translocase FtsK [Candidatus Methylomirabilia bacterium]